MQGSSGEKAAGGEPYYGNRRAHPEATEHYLANRAVNPSLAPHAGRVGPMDGARRQWRGSRHGERGRGERSGEHRANRADGDSDAQESAERGAASGLRVATKASSRTIGETSQSSEAAAAGFGGIGPLAPAAGQRGRMLVGARRRSLSADGRDARMGDLGSRVGRRRWPYVWWSA